MPRAATCAASVSAIRSHMEPLGVWSLGLGTWAVLWRLATLRGRRTHLALVISPSPLPGAALLLGLAVVAMVVAVSGLLGVVVSR